jgi:transcriptional regulator with XRE-family HTH domain
MEPFRDPRVTVPSAFRDAIAAQDRSIRAVALEAGMHPSHLSKALRGKAGVSVGSLVRLAGVLGLTEVTRALGPLIERRSA